MMLYTSFRTPVFEENKRLLSFWQWPVFIFSTIVLYASTLHRVWDNNIQQILNYGEVIHHSDLSIHLDIQMSTKIQHFTSKHFKFFFFFNINSNYMRLILNIKRTIVTILYAIIQYFKLIINSYSMPDISYEQKFEMSINC